MTEAANRHARAKQVFLDTCELSAADCSAFLDDACVDDQELRASVEAMLAIEIKRPGFLQVPVASTEGPDLPPPAYLGSFKVLDRIGEGSMGTVYRARQENPSRMVAVKVLRSGFGGVDALRRFELESELLGRLRHAGIARIFEAGRTGPEEGHLPYFAMELIDGLPITRYARERNLSLRARLELIASVADAVHHAHQQGVIHRDLKPANILVQDSGQPSVLDFGVARSCDGNVELASFATRTGQLVGTLSYMSPEQAAGDPAEIDARTDVYALGVVLHELLARELPYDITTWSLPLAVRIIQVQEPRRLGSLHASYRGDVETIVRTALDKDKRRRYSSASALAADIRHYIANEPIKARPPTPGYVMRKFVRRNRVLVAASSAVLLALILGFLGALQFAFVAEQSDRQARALSYRLSVWAAQQAIENRNFGGARGLLDGAPQENKNWEWRHIDRRLEHRLTELEVEDVWAAFFLDDIHVLAIDANCSRLTWNTLTDETTRQDAANPAQPVALSNDRRWLVSWSQGQLHRQELHTGASATRSIPFNGPAPKTQLGSSTISSDGERLALTTTSEELFLVDLEGVNPTREIEVPPGAISRVRFGPSGRDIAVGAVGRISMIDATSLEPRWMEQAATTVFRAIEFNGDGSVVMTASEAGVLFFDTITGSKLENWDSGEHEMRPMGTASALRLSHDGQSLAATFQRRQIWVLERDDARLRSVLVHDGAGSVGSSWSPNDTALLTIGAVSDSSKYAATLRLWDVRPTPGVDVLTGHSDYVYPIAVNSDGSMLASGSFDRTVRLWDPVSAEEIAVVKLGHRVLALAFAPDGNSLAIGGRDMEYVVVSMRTGELLFESGGKRICRALAFAPDGTWLASSLSERVVLYDTAPFRETHAVRVLGIRIATLAAHPNGRWLAAGTSDSVVALLDTQTGECIASARFRAGGSNGYEGILSSTFNSSGERLYVGTGRGAILALAVPSLEVVTEFPPQRDEVFALQLSPDESRLASGGRDGLLQLWSTDKPEVMGRFPAHDRYIYSLVYDPKGEWIATGSGDRSVRIWHAATSAKQANEARRIRHSRTLMSGRVNEMYDRAGSPAQAIADLHSTPGLGETQIRVARQLILRRGLADSANKQ